MLQVKDARGPTTDVQTPDELLVRRAREGDARLARNYSFATEAKLRVAYRYLGHEQDALDVVQESMLKAFSALADFDGRSGFRTWLLRIVTNTSLDWGRRRKRRPRLRIGDGDPDDIRSQPPSTIRPGGCTSKTYARPSTRP